MSDIKKSFADLIGNTPLYAAEKFAEKVGANATILAKLEYFNPAGSVKDRIANAMINEVWRLSRRPAATASSSPCPRPCPSSAAICSRPTARSWF